MWITHFVIREIKAAGEFVDVTLACEGHQLPAHQVVLSAASPFFMQLLKVGYIMHKREYSKSSSLVSTTRWVTLCTSESTLSHLALLVLPGGLHYVQARVL